MQLRFTGKDGKSFAVDVRGPHEAARILEKDIAMRDAIGLPGVSIVLEEYDAESRTWRPWRDPANGEEDFVRYAEEVPEPPPMVNGMAPNEFRIHVVVRKDDNNFRIWTDQPDPLLPGHYSSIADVLSEYLIDADIKLPKAMGLAPGELDVQVNAIGTYAIHRGQGSAKDWIEFKFRVISKQPLSAEQIAYLDSLEEQSA